MKKKTEKQVFKTVPINSVHTASPFKELMPFDQKTVGMIADSMKAFGYDFAWPIVVWAGHNKTVVDGHLRLAAAHLAGLKKVVTIEREFNSENDACIYALQNNIFRGQHTDEEIDTITDKVKFGLLERNLKKLLDACHVLTVKVTL